MPARQRIEVRRNRTNFGPFLKGVNELAAPYLLGREELSNAENIDIDRTVGRVTKRPGSSVLSASIPILNSTPRNAYEFIKSDGTRRLLITDDDKVIVTDDLVSFTELYPALIPGASNLNNAFFLEFETAQDKVWMSNGNDFVMSYDGTTLVQYDKGTTEITWDAGTDTQTTIQDALLDRAGSGTWEGHIVVCTNATNTSNIGITRTVTNFDDGTDTITFDSAFPATISAGDKFLVGVQIPRGRSLRFHFSTMFMAATPENQSEVRFNADVDPNEPNIIMGIDNPNAWPALNQFTVAENDGDRVWGLTPVYRDRFLVHKSTGLFRVDPDPTFQFVPKTVSKEVGSRFPRTFQEKDGLMIFIGSKTDGLPEMFSTDSVSVRNFGRKHSKTLENILRPDQFARSIIRGTTPELGLGNFSDTVQVSDGKISLKKFNTEALWKSVLTSGTNIDVESSPGKVTIQGLPDFDVKFDGKLFGTPPFSETLLGGIGRSEGSSLFVFRATPTAPLQYRLERFNDFTSSEDLFARFRYAVVGTVPSASFTFANGAKSVNIQSNGSLQLFVNSTFVGTIASSVFDEFAVLLKADGTFKVWRNGTLLNSGTALNSGANTAQMFLQLAFGGTSGVLLDYIRYHKVFKGDNLDSLGGAVSPTTLPDVLPTTGSVDLTFDYKKVMAAGLDQYGKFSVDETLNSGTIAKSTASSIDNSFYSSFSSILDDQEPGVDNATPIRRYLRYRSVLTQGTPDSGPSIDALVGGGLYMTDPLFISGNIASWALFIEESLLNGASIDTREIRRSTNPAGSPPDPLSTTGWDTALAGSDAEGFLSISPNNNIGTVLGDGSPPTSTYVQLMWNLSPSASSDSPEIDFFSVNWLEGNSVILPANAIVFQDKYIVTVARSASVNNDLLVILDGANSFYNWTGINANHLFFFQEKPLFLRSTGQDILQIEPGIFTDEGSPFTAFLESKQAILGDIGTLKKMRYLDCQGTSALSTVTFSFKGDRDIVFNPLGTVTFDPTTTHRRLNFPIGSMARRMILRAENSNDEDFGLDLVILGWENMPSRSGV